MRLVGTYVYTKEAYLKQLSLLRMGKVVHATIHSLMRYSSLGAFGAFAGLVLFGGLGSLRSVEHLLCVDCQSSVVLSVAVKQACEVRAMNWRVQGVQRVHALDAGGNARAHPRSAKYVPSLKHTGEGQDDLENFETHGRRVCAKRHVDGACFLHLWLAARLAKLKAHAARHMQRLDICKARALHLDEMVIMPDCHRCQLLVSQQASESECQ